MCWSLTDSHSTIPTCKLGSIINYHGMFRRGWCKTVQQGLWFSVETRGWLNVWKWPYYISLNIYCWIIIMSFIGEPTVFFFLNCWFAYNCWIPLEKLLYTLYMFYLYQGFSFQINYTSPSSIHEEDKMNLIHTYTNLTDVTSLEVMIWKKL